MRKVLAVLGAIASFAVILIAAGLGRFGGKVAVDMAMRPSKKDMLEAAAKQINQKLPILADAETRLDSATPSADDQTLSYSYTLVNWSAGQLNAAQLVQLKQMVIDRTCASPEKTLLGKGIALEFLYHSNDGSLVQDFRIGPNKCLYNPFAKHYGVVP